MPERQFYKFPSTPYLLPPTVKISRQDRVLSTADVEMFYSETVTVEEKIDGANLGIAFDSEGEIHLQNRGHYLLKPYSGQWKALDKWIDQRMDTLFDVLTDKYIIFGEWCYLSHSIYYNALPDWFIAFDIYDKQNEKFLSVKNRNVLAEKMGLALVPHVFTGQISREILEGLIGKSAYGDEECEGLYLRIDSSDYLRYRAKFVRNSFSQSIETHWSKKAVKRNLLRTGLR